MSNDQNSDEHPAGTAIDANGGQIRIDSQQVPRRRFHPVVIKGGLTPRSEVSDVDRIWERLIRLGVRPGGPTFAEAMKQRLREEFPGLTEEDLDSIAKHHF